MEPLNAWGMVLAAPPQLSSTTSEVVIRAPADFNFFALGVFFFEAGFISSLGARHLEGVEHDRLNHKGTDKDLEAREAHVQGRGWQLQVRDVEGAEDEARHHEGVERGELNHEGQNEDREAREANVQGRGG